MITIGYLHIGPPASGVRRFGRMIATQARCRSDVAAIEADIDIPAPDPSTAPMLQQAGGVLSKASVVHIQYNAKSWGGGRRHVQNLRSFMDACSSRIVCTIHDVYPFYGAAELLRRASLRLWRPASQSSAGHVAGGASSARGFVAPPVRYAGFSLGPAARGLRFLADRARRLLVCSQVEAKRLTEMRPRCPVSVIPHFVEERAVPQSKSSAKQALRLDGRQVVTLLGFIVPRKGHDLLLEAIPCLPNDVVVIFAGGPPTGGEAYAHALRRLTQVNGTEDRVRITGYLSEDELQQYLAATDLAVCPFETLSASGSVATWISAGKPILASDLPQFQEYNEMESDAITTFGTYSGEALAHGIREHLGASPPDVDPSIVRLRERLLLPQIVERHMAVYREVAAENRADQTVARRAAD